MMWSTLNLQDSTQPAAAENESSAETGAGQIRSGSATPYSGFIIEPSADVDTITARLIDPSERHDWLAPRGDGRVTMAMEIRARQNQDGEPRCLGE